MGQPRRTSEILGVALLVSTAIGLRLWWYSGLGLGDDVLLRADIAGIVYSHTVQASPNAYRFVWWLPTAITCRLFGFGEAGLIAPIVACVTAGMLAVYAIARRLWGHRAGLLALALLAVNPLDFAWSTMLTTDVFLSFFAATSMLGLISALDAPSATARRRWYGATACSLALAFHAKVSAALLGIPVCAAALLERQRIHPDVWRFVVTLSVLLGISAAVAYAFTGDWLAPLSAELWHQGLTRPDAVAFHRLTWDVFTSYPRWLFSRNQLGDFVFGFQAHAVVALALLGRPLRFRGRGILAVWLAAVILGMQFNVQRHDGVWVAGFRNIRHAHPWVYPIVLFLTGELVAFHAWRPRLASIVTGVLLVAGLATSIRVADRTAPIFAQLRELTTALHPLPGQRVIADYQIGTRFALGELGQKGWNVRELNLIDASIRRREIATSDAAYLVTGGGREPYYGCIDCIPRATELNTEEWQLVREWPMPVANLPWWPEPLRLWKRRQPPA